MLELIVVRHGESIRNYASKIAHQGDLTLLDTQLKEDDYEPGWSLTELGQEQAEKTGKWIEEVWGSQPDIVFASPYRRTLQTARCLNLKPIALQDWRLRERRWGDYTAVGEPYTAEQYLEDLRHAGEPNWRPPFPGAEAVQDLIPQVREFVVDNLTNLDGKKVVLVTHGGAMKALQSVIEGSVDDPTQTSVPNSSALRFRLNSLDDEGKGNGDVDLETPWMPDGGHGHWQHFG